MEGKMGDRGEGVCLVENTAMEFIDRMSVKKGRALFKPVHTVDIGWTCT